MKYSVRLNTTKGFDTFEKVINFFYEKFPFLNIEDNDWLHSYGKFLDNTKYPCNKINLIAFLPYDNRFAVEYFYNDTRIAYHEIEIEINNVMKTKSITYDKKDFKIFEHILTQYINSYNNNILEQYINKTNITKDKCTIVVLEYTNYKPNGNTQTLNGTLEQIFDTYTTHNDRLKYCNGMFWRFQNKHISKLYSLFIQTYNGNYFLDNAVKRGVTID